jgi:2-methylisocitrate lyase-like PEP mutase family enzyme
VTALPAGPVVAPPVYDGFTALIAARAGAAAVSVPVAGTAAQLGLEPGAVSVDELVDNVRYIATVVAIPVIADARGMDDVQRAAQQFAQAGAAAVIVDDPAAIPAPGIALIAAGDVGTAVTIPAGGHELSIAAVRDALAELRATGGGRASFVGLPFEEVTSLLGLDEVYELERRYSTDGEAG